MPWVKLDEGFPEHPKVLRAGPGAAWLFVCGLAYANRNLTDGFIPDVIVPRLAELKGCVGLARRLADVGMWEKVDGGYRIHDYLTYQPSAAKLKEERDRTAARVAAWREGRRNAVTAGSTRDDLADQKRMSNGVTEPFANADVTPLVTPPPVRSGPDPVPVPLQTSQRELATSSSTYGADAPKAASSSPAPSRNIFLDASEGAREVLDHWRVAHGKRQPPKLNPTQLGLLETAVADLGVERLKESATWSAERGLPEFDKCIRAAYTKRQQEEQAAESSQIGAPRAVHRRSTHGARVQAREGANPTGVVSPFAKYGGARS